MKPAKVISPWGTHEDRRRERELKTQAVLHSAIQLFNEKGFYATSMDDVARQLHVTKPTLYHYFSNKEDILFQCVLLGLRQLQDGIDEIVARDAPALEKLRLAIIKYAEVTFTEAGIWVVRAGEEPLAIEKRRELRRIERHIDAHFRALIETAVGEGALVPCNTKMVVSMIAGTINWVIRWYKSGGSLSVTGIGEYVTTLLLQGLLVRNAPATPNVNTRRKPNSKAATRLKNRK